MPKVNTVNGSRSSNKLTEVRLEGFSLPVEDVSRSLKFYGETLGFKVEVDAAPDFGMIRVGKSRTGGTIGFLSSKVWYTAASKSWTPKNRSAIHVELSTDDLDGLYQQLKDRGVHFDHPPTNRPWERAMDTRDPDGYTVEFAQGRRGGNQATPNK